MCECGALESVCIGIVLGNLQDMMYPEDHQVLMMVNESHEVSYSTHVDAGLQSRLYLLRLRAERHNDWCCRAARQQQTPSWR